MKAINEIITANENFLNRIVSEKKDLLDSKNDSLFLPYSEIEYKIELIYEYVKTKNINGPDFYKLERLFKKLVDTKKELKPYINESRYENFENIYISIDKEDNSEKPKQLMEEDCSRTEYQKRLNDYYFKSFGKSNTQKPTKKIQQYFLNLTNTDNFLLQLKSAFPTEKGISIRAIINILQIEKILNIPSRGNKAFIELLRNYFQRDIGSYQSINDSKNLDNETTAPIQKILKPLIHKYKVN